MPRNNKEYLRDYVYTNIIYIKIYCKLFIRKTSQN